MQIKQKKSSKTGFSLIELSIVILIVSILITGSLGISKTAINNAKIKVTKERMDEVYKAFSNYLANNRRLPCPASMTVSKGTVTTYGAESATPGTCTGAFISSNASNLAYGMVPILALNLDPDMAEDGFGTKFTYVVDRRFTLKSASTTSVNNCTTTTPPSCGFEITKGVVSEADNPTTADLSGIDAQGPAGTSLLPNKNGVLLLLSHGSDKSKGFNATGTAQDTTVGVADENNNSCDQTSACATTSTASFDRVFIANSSDPNFDDMVLFKNKAQLVRDAGLEFIMCSPSEANVGSLTWKINGSYGCSVCSTTTENNQKLCGKYGIWGSLQTTNICTPDRLNCSASTEAGQVINMLAYSVGGEAISIRTTSASVFTPINSTTYQPKSPNSNIYIEYNASYYSAGFNSDDWYSRIVVNGTTIVEGYQLWNANNGGGTRSGTLLPIQGVFPNNSMSPIAIFVVARRNSGDDTFVFNREHSWFRITEIAR